MNGVEFFEGLNLPQLLDRMHGVVMPEAVSWLPQTAGWWVMGAWLLAVALLVAWHAHRAWSANRYRRAALLALTAIELRSNPNGATQIAVLLKRTALAAYPRDKVAHLYGAEWARFLSESADDDPLIAACADEMAAAAYRKDADVGALVEPTRRWIELHRA